MLAKEYPASIVRKRHGTVYTTAGDPDLTILYSGIHIECELKRPGEEARPLQLRRLEQWRAAGAVTAVVHSVAEMRQVMEEACSPSHCPKKFTSQARPVSPPGA